MTDQLTRAARAALIDAVRRAGDHSPGTADLLLAALDSPDRAAAVLREHHVDAARLRANPLSHHETGEPISTALERAVRAAATGGGRVGLGDLLACALADPESDAAVLLSPLVPVQALAARLRRTRRGLRRGVWERLNRPPAPIRPVALVRRSVAGLVVSLLPGVVQVTTGLDVLAAIIVVLVLFGWSCAAARRAGRGLRTLATTVAAVLYTAAGGAAITGRELSAGTVAGPVGLGLLLVAAMYWCSRVRLGNRRW
jgi:hypothetical protein